MSASPPHKRARACSENQNFTPEGTISQSPNPSHNDKHCLECEEWRAQYQKAHTKEIDAAYTKGCIEMASDRIGKWSNAFEGEKRKIEQDAHEEGIREGRSDMQELLDSRNEELGALREEMARLKQVSILDREELRLYRQADQELREARHNDQQLLQARQDDLEALCREVDALRKSKEVGANICQNLRMKLEEQQSATDTERVALRNLDTIVKSFDMDLRSCSNHQQKLSNYRAFLLSHWESLNRYPIQIRDKVCVATVRAFKSLGLAMPELFPPGFWSSLGQTQMESNRAQYLMRPPMPSSHGVGMSAPLRPQAQQPAHFEPAPVSQSYNTCGPQLRPLSVPAMPPGVQIFTPASNPLPQVTASIDLPGMPSIQVCYGKRPKAETDNEKLVYRVGSEYVGRRVLTLHPDCVRTVPKCIPLGGKWVYIERPAIPLVKVAVIHDVPGCQWPFGDYDTNGDYLGFE